MTDDEIIKALECCGEVWTDCGGCSRFTSEYPSNIDECRACLITDAIDLINRQKAEIERLTVNMNAFKLGLIREADGNKTARANAIKEFAERLKEKQKQINITYNLDYDVVFVSEIDNLVKEMVGDKNENESQTG